MIFFCKKELNMPKSSVTYAPVAEACQALLGEGQKITLRAIDHYIIVII